MSERFTYRLFEERDLPGLLRLWEDAGWGTLTERQWREWYVETPHGAALVVVAVDEQGEVAGQEMFMPSLLHVDGREVRALRFSAPILRKELRGRSLRHGDHPVVGLYKTAAIAATQQGFSVVYSLPEHGWLPIFRLGPRFGIPRFAVADYPCVALPVASNGPAVSRLAEGLKACAVEEFGEEYDGLWQSAKESFPVNCGVVRRRDWLRFRNSGRFAVEVRDALTGELVGYTATKKQTGLLADIFARCPEDLERVVAATLRWFAAAQAGDVPEAFTHLKVMQTPALNPALEEFETDVVDYRFAFTCNTFDASIKLDQIAPERWYVMPGD